MLCFIRAIQSMVLWLTRVFENAISSPPETLASSIQVLTSHFGVLFLPHMFNFTQSMRNMANENPKNAL